MKRFFILFELGFLSSLSTPQELRPESCGYKTCHDVDDTKINVHLIPHSHDDVGWLQTVDQYFYNDVQYIITNAVQALRSNKKRRYVQVETAFFRKWWSEVNEVLRQDFVDLVNNGQIEMVGGGISMNDEACTNYQSTIDQFTWGFRFLNDTLGACGIPKIGWQIDTFGHSREQASIFTQLGFEAFYFSRLDLNDKQKRKDTKQMEFLWQASDSLENSQIFGSIFPNEYTTIANLRWDLNIKDQSIVDDLDSPDYNVPKYIKIVKHAVDKYQNWFQTNNVLFLMGGDFHYKLAEMNFLNMDKLIKIFNNNSEINLIYSTPSCYLKAVNDANPMLPLKTNDFFPYANGPNQYWTGFYTSRPNSKRFERMGNNILQGTKQLTAFAKILNNIDYTDDINDLREEMGIMQHHDAITGTEQQHVANDYVRRLTKGIRTAESHMNEVIGSLIAKDSMASLDIKLHSCLLSNISVCTTKAGKHIIVVYNPLAQPVTTYIRIPVPLGTYKLIAPNGNETNFSIVSPISNFYVNVADGPPLPREMVIKVENLSPMGAKVFQLEIKPMTKKSKSRRKSRTRNSLQYKFGSREAGFELDPNTNLLKYVTINGKTLEISQQFLSYESSKEEFFSGPYFFRPKKNTVAKPLTKKVTIELRTSTGLVDEVVQVINRYIRQIIRVYKGSKQPFVEFDWLVGPLPYRDKGKMGTEVISRFQVKNFNSELAFYTDSNGRELIKRQLNHRPDYEYNSAHEPIASNYYPVTSKILIRDEYRNLEVTILTDRSQGGTSLNYGQLELMVHRRLFHDDYQGVGEPLNEIEFGQGVVVRGSHLLTFGQITPLTINESAAAIRRTLALKKLLAPLVLIGKTNKSVEEIDKHFNFEFAPISTALPENVNILTFEPWGNDSYILRLEHFFAKLEDSLLSNEVTVDLNALFTNFKFTSIEETTLGVNQWLNDFIELSKFTWRTSEGPSSWWTIDTSKDNGTIITLTPMQIRTFIVKV